MAPQKPDKMGDQPWTDTPTGTVGEECVSLNVLFSLCLVTAAGFH